jgi:hypothetical protein
MKVAPDHDWTDGFDVSNSIRLTGNLSRVLGPELRNTFASVPSERLPEAWIIYLARLEAASAQSRQTVADTIVPQRMGM